MDLSFEKLDWTGRFLDIDGVRYFDYSASSFEFSFCGTSASCLLLSNPKEHGDNVAVVAVFTAKYGEDYSTEPDKRIILTESVNEIKLFESDRKQKVSVKVMKYSEAAFAYAGLKNVEIDGKLLKTKDCSKAPKIEFIGDSITCGYGIEGKWNVDSFSTKTERPDLAYAYKTAKKLGAQYSLVSWSGIGLTSTYIDESVSDPDNFWTMDRLWPYTDRKLSLTLKKEPEVWDESAFSPDVVVINIGTNDKSWTRGDSGKTKVYVSAYRSLIEAVHRRSPEAKICCCLGIMGQELCQAIEQAVGIFKVDFPSVKIKTVTFDVQDEADGIGADWHPSAVTHEKAATLLARELKEFI